MTKREIRTPDDLVDAIILTLKREGVALDGVAPSTLEYIRELTRQFYATSNAHTEVLSDIHAQLEAERRLRKPPLS